MKKRKNLFAIILSTMMLLGMVISANASTYVASRVLCTNKSCPQINLAVGQEGFCSCGQPFYKYVCVKCGTSYKAWPNLHYHVEERCITRRVPGGRNI